MNGHQFSVVLRFIRLRFVIVLLIAAAVTLFAGTAGAQSRIFDLYLQNGTDVAVNFRVSDGAYCTDFPIPGTEYGPVAPGARVKLTVARVQGNDCDGKNGRFSIIPSNGDGERQYFTFDNEGNMALNSYPDNYSGVLSPKSLVDESFTWTMRETDSRLTAPLDERLTMPRNYIAADSGKWAPLNSQTLRKEHLPFINQSWLGFWGNFFERCFGKEFFHPQHTVRLPNKNGHAYFMVSQSRGHNGYIYLLEVPPENVDPVTDVIKLNSNGTPVGKIVWQDLYLGNPIGNWNHPAKMALVGGVLVVVAQNWSEGVPVDGCSGDSSNPYLRGSHSDAILFYDVRDSEHPVFWGAMTSTELKLPRETISNGPRQSIIGPGHIDVVSLVRSPKTDEWILTAGGGDSAPPYVSYKTSSITPDITMWTQIPNQYLIGEHGLTFNSYQIDKVQAETVPPNGEERIMSFDTISFTGDDATRDGFEFLNFEFNKPAEDLFAVGTNHKYRLFFEDANRHWDADSIYITRQGMPIVYTVESEYGENPVLYQVYDTRNFALQTPHEPRVVSNCEDSGAGSLRNAIGFGGKITFDPDLDCDTIKLISGPLIVYLYDVEIDASALAGGITVDGQNESRVLQIEPGNTVSLESVRIINGHAKVWDAHELAGQPSDLYLHEALGGGILNRGDLTIRSSTISHNRAENNGGGIYNLGVLKIYNSTIAHNQAAYNGGGLASASGTVLLENSTVGVNTAESKWAGGIFNDGTSQMHLRHTTVARNRADAVAGGIFSAGTASLIQENSIIAGNVVKSNDPSDSAGNYTAVGATLIEKYVYGARGGVPTILEVDPLLGNLADNGGPTSTMAPGAGSPAVDAAAPSDIGGDQRGQFRPTGPAPDLGSVEKLGGGYSPAQGEMYVDLQGTQLSWNLVSGALYELFWDNGTGNLVSKGLTDKPFYTPNGPLKPDTTYKWRVDITFSGHTVVGEVLSFTTRGDLVVTTLADEDDGGLGQGLGDSLRECIAAADAGDAITFDSALSGQTIALSGTQIDINKGLTIDASALPAGIRIDAGGKSRVFAIKSTGTVIMKKLTISGGNSSFGGGIINESSTLSLQHSLLANNQSPDFGGGLYNWQGGKVTIVDSTVSGNLANKGGGVYHNGDNGGALTINRATLAANSAADEGGGVFIAGSSGLVENSTLSGNSSATDKGAGIWSQGNASLTLRHATVVGNTGTGLRNNAPASLTLENSIVANNFNQNNSPFDVQGNYVAKGANLIRFHSGTRISGPAPLTVDPGLESLGSYGGPTQSMAPLLGSPVIDAAVATAQSPGNDQRGGGYQRPEGGAPDIGSIESDLVSDANLIKLTTSAGQLDPAFLPDIVDYTVRAANDTTSAAVRAFSATGGEEIEVRSNNGSYQTLNNGVISPFFPLNSGENTIQVRVTAQNGVTKKTYTLKVIRDLSSTRLSALTTNSGSLNPAFNPETLTYNTAVSNGTTSTTVRPTAVDPQATITVYGDFNVFNYTVNSGANSPAIPLHEGCNNIYIRVTDRNGSASAVYTLQVTRALSSVTSTSTGSVTGSMDTVGPLFTPGAELHNQGVDAAGAHSLLWASKNGNNASSDPAVSSSGRFVAFSSRANNLVNGDTNNKEDIFVYDRDSNTIERVSLNNSGGQGDDDSSNPSISADGRFVAFQSEATNLVPSDTNGNVDRSFGRDIFVYDRNTDKIERVSLTDSGGQSNQASETPSISGNGRYVAFASSANNLVSGFANGEADVYIYDRTADSISGIAVPFDFLANRSSLNPDFSEDGKVVAFEFAVDLNADNQDDSYRYTDIYAYDRVAKVVTRISGVNSGRDADGNKSEEPSISANGRFIAYQSNLESIDFYDTNNAVDVFVTDRVTGDTERVSLDSAGNEGIGESTRPAISGNTLFVAFESRVSSFVSPDNNGDSDVFMKDLTTGELWLLSKNNSGTQGNQGSFAPSLSYDASSAAFHSNGTNLGTPDNNSASDVFVALTSGLPRTSPADLASLAVSEGAINPCFAPNSNSYSAKVGNDVNSIRVKAEAAEYGADVAIQLNSASVNPAAVNVTTSPLPLTVGENVVEVKVTAPDGSTQKSYTLAVNRAANSNAELINLSVRAEALLPLTPNFSGGTTSYTTSVPYTTSSVEVIPVAAYEKATIKVNGQTVASGATSSAISLGVGSNQIAVQVTAENGTTSKSYVVTVTRAANTRPVAIGQTVNALDAVNEIGIVLTGYDSDGDALTFEIISEPTNGTLSGSPPNIFYKPDPETTGNDLIRFKVNDGTADSAAAAVHLFRGDPIVYETERVYLPMISRK